MADLFEKSYNQLSEYNLDDLLVASSLFSVMNSFDNFPDGECYFQPMMNIVKTNMFTKAVLYSDSSYFKSHKLLPDHIPSILNNLTKAADRVEMFDDSKLGNDEKIDLLIESLYSSQLWYHRDTIRQKIPIAYSLYVELPNRYKDELINLYGDKFIDIPSFIENDLGIRLDKYFTLSIFLRYILFGEIYNQYLLPDKSKRDYINSLAPHDGRHLTERQNLILQNISRINDFYKILTFTANSSIFSKTPILKIVNFLSGVELNAYFKLTSKSIHELRELNKRNEYKIGHISQRLTPLERYPIVKMDTQSYIIPNLSLFEISISESLRFAIQEHFSDNRFHNIMGTIQEYLVHDLLRQFKKKDFIIVSERTYNKPEIKGPDFIVIENGNPILIEVKAKQLLLSTRLNPSGEELDSNLTSIYEAFEKLQSYKLNDLYENPIYSDVQPQLKNKDKTKPLFVGIISEGVISMQEQVTKIKRKNPSHRLNEIKYPCIFIDVVHFFKLIEICKFNDKSLYELLLNYWTVGEKLEPKAFSADSFEGLRYDGDKSYTKSVMDSLLKSAFK